MNPLAPVSEIMTSNVITVSPNDTILNVKHIFNEHRIHHIPVIEEGNLVGMVSKSDFLKVSPGLYFNSEAEDAFFEKVHVEKIMTTKIAKVKANERIDVVALIFHENLFHAVPVLNEADELVGIVTSFDLIEYAFPITEKAWAE